MIELDLQNPEHLADFERGFYTAFAPIENKLIRKLWQWDDEAGRLRTRVPYEEQKIYAAFEGDQLRWSLAVGTKLQTVQSADYGFQIPPGEENCEALTFFNVGGKSLRGGKNFYEACRVVLTEQGFTNLYGTCSPALLGLYRWIGGEVVETREIDGVVRHFFCIHMDHWERWRPRE